jgi:hypothetical protein
MKGRKQCRTSRVVLKKFGPNMVCRRYRFAREDFWKSSKEHRIILGAKKGSS